MTSEPKRRTAPPRRSGGLFWLILIIGLGILACAVVVVLMKHQAHDRQVAQITREMATPTVLAARPKIGPAEVHLVLPGTVSALIESSVYAQVSGYVKDWKYDIGAKVKANDVLADIDTPVLDQQLLQAGESVKQSQANLDLAKVTAARYDDLQKTNAVSQQDVDTFNSQEKVQEANLSAAKAFETGIEKSEAFKQVRAPFDGVITARRIDVGDYVTSTGQIGTTAAGPTGAAQTGTPNQELFRIAQTRLLRIYVNVPEQYAAETRPGVKATVNLASAPNDPLTGTIVRTADAIDPASLTLLTEVDVDNSDGKHLPGGYAQVHFDIVTAHPPLVVPGNTLIFRQAGAQVGVVDDNGIVHLKKIIIGRDLGTSLEITDGITADDQVIVNPS
ncbi:MAG TPA: efflux RND transporter periplasmic adaptor subunit, partial [Candidatus Methylacidiphilales bacterium]|nr:efflux RND transporter periplasmic adaptor subunit [Candidatus Methylacidiphilales bacterium]